MKCPECQTEGEKSRVFLRGSRTTAAHHWPYYDEDGIYHDHDPNTVTSAYHCSRKHSWETKSKRPCPAEGCDYGKEKTEE